ncbi:sensor histidine kinase [Plantactinospora mayteni]|uniref:histidine kinase n=1 Tax=Plantactinospora mayteni TaxID=566021 RepID=A0ABQ4EMC5_9ACTN|nr:nitrate- and nitrite sensing domain-containing protein [Plantactinospora mayteni]GIG95802.1 histidine kinase [Plantactinospora mayteni]
METQNWPIRSKIVALVAVPILALSALWIFATTLTVGPASSLLAAQTLLDEVGRPGETLVVELQQERRLSVRHLVDPAATTALADQRTRTDRAIAEFRRRTSDADLRDTTGALLDARIDQLLTSIDALRSGRTFIDRRTVDASGALGLYSGVIDAAFRTFSALNTLPDDTLAREARSLTELGRAREVMAQADALLAGAFSTGRFAPGEHAQYVQIVGTQRFLYSAATAELPDAERVAYQQLTEGDAYVRLRQMEDNLIGRGGGGTLPVDAREWQSSYDSVQRQLRDFELSGAEALTERSRPVAAGILLRLGLAGLVGFLAVLLSAVIALRIGRSLVRRLTSLRAAALNMADERLPDVVGRLRRGEEVDVETEAPPLDYGQDEIGQVGQAFSEVQRTAIASAIDEAALRRGLRDVFLNIARRSQTLLHRQLALLDRMERRVAQPDELEDLFRLDHMATRMRRHAEDLVVLAGAAPGRGWRNPVSMMDVIRGAISEVEDYARVDLVTVAPAATAGRAVGDVIHLLAELIENATSFSPPHTRVQVVGQVVSNGYAIEIEDRGLGMAAEALDQANRRLADPPDFDPANSARLGLFVVALLGARHGVRVQLRSSPYGGVTAVALIPGDLVVPDTSSSAGDRGDASGAEPDGTTRRTGPGRIAGGADGSETIELPMRPGRTARVSPDGDEPHTEPDSTTGLGPRRKAGAALAALVAASRPETPEPTPSADGGERLTGAGTTRDAPTSEPADSAAGPGGAAPDDGPETGRAGGVRMPKTGGLRRRGIDPAAAPTTAAPTTATPTPATATPATATPATMTPATATPATAAPVEAAGPSAPAGPAPRPAMDDDTVVLPAVRASAGPVRPAAGPVGADGLPRRIRQKSLAPQLRNGPVAGSDRSAAAGGTGAGEPDEPQPRTPEQIRAVMAALQSGTARGRRDAEDQTPPGDTAEDTARVADPGVTTSEGDG